MKITKEDKMYLERCRFGRKDLAQIQEATRRDKTTYEMDGAPITREEAIARLGPSGLPIRYRQERVSLHGHAYRSGPESDPV